MNKLNLVMCADSYKYGHAGQMPENLVSQYDYIEARFSKKYDSVCFFGLQYYLDILTKPITMHDVVEAANQAQDHGIPFDTTRWKYIVEKCEGLLPLKIKAIPEGTNVPLFTPLVVVESTDPKAAWVTGWVETLLLKVWYTSTVATHAGSVLKTLQERGGNVWAQFALHMFGDRASSSVETAALAGMAHLVHFRGTDNFNAIAQCKKTYDEPIAGYSVFATEHSTTTSNGRDGEEAFVYNQLLKHPNAPIMSFVADSYDVFNFVDFCTKPGSRIRELVLSRPHQKLVLRPDSGDAVEILTKLCTIAFYDNKWPTFEMNAPFTFKQLGFLWGDGIDQTTITEIISSLQSLGYSPENFVFGMGGNMVHKGFDRDTLGFAMKCSSITVDEGHPFETGNVINGLPEMEWEEALVELDVFKDPITDPGKKSKRGRVTTILHEGEYKTCLESEVPSEDCEALIPVYHNGTVLKRYTFEEIRTNAKL